jgi:hypothetical protein
LGEKQLSPSQDNVRSLNTTAQNIHPLSYQTPKQWANSVIIAAIALTASIFKSSGQSVRNGLLEKEICLISEPTLQIDSVLGYRSGVPGSIPGTTRKKK